MGEMGEFYKALLEKRQPRLPELRLQYPDYAVWERKWLSGNNLERLEHFWRRQLFQVPLLEIPTDHPRPPRLRLEGEFLMREAPADLFQWMTALAQEHQTTPFTVFTAVTAELVHRLSSQGDFVIGVPSENRNLPGAEFLIGSFLNVVPLRIDRSGEPTFVEFLRQVRNTLLDAYNHQALPITKIVEMAGVTRQPDRMPLVQVSCELQLEQWLSLELPGCRYEYEFVSHGTARYEMAFHGMAKSDHLLLAVELNKTLWQESTGYKLLADLQAGLAEILADPTRPLSTYRFQWVD
jgi:non-ribosomal peptide synthetase component F